MRDREGLCTRAFDSVRCITRITILEKRFRKSQVDNVIR